LKVYLDTSVLNVYLFGKFSDIEVDRFPTVSDLFTLINSGKVHAIVSLYSIQEIYSFCKKIFHHEVGHVARLSFLKLLNNEIELSGLLSREERLLHRAKFILDDLSDEPHAISAFLNKCDAIVTYDEHFQKIKDILPVYAPEELVSNIVS